MLTNLNPPYNCEVWINKKLEFEIENCFKSKFKCDKLYYYYYSCKGKNSTDPCNGKHKLVWLGPIGLIDYIKKVQKVCKKFNAPELGVTNISNKSAFEKYEKQLKDHLITPNDYWIGDVNRSSNMICGDKLFNCLWIRIRDKVSKQ